MKIDPKIKKDLKERLRADLEQKKRQVTVVCAYKIGADEIKELKEKVPLLKEGDIKWQVDSSIIAGYVVKVGSKVLDLSLQGQLQNFKKLIYGID